MLEIPKAEADLLDHSGDSVVRHLGLFLELVLLKGIG
jgi:hypothetical protein